MAHPILRLAFGFLLLLVLTGLLTLRGTINALSKTPSQLPRLWFLKSKLKAIQTELFDHLRFQADLPYVIQRAVQVLVTLAVSTVGVVVGVVLAVWHSAWQFFYGEQFWSADEPYTARLITGNPKLGVLVWLGFMVVYCTLVVLTTQIRRLYKSLVDPTRYQMQLESERDALALKLGITLIDTDRWSPRNLEKFFNIGQP